MRTSSPLTRHGSALSRLSLACALACNHRSYDALGEFFSVEDLGGDNCYRCERCQTLQRATKRLRTLSLPAVLPLHLKRFRFGATARKASERIVFPLTDLSLSPFVAPAVGSASHASSQRGGGGGGHASKRTAAHGVRRGGSSSSDDEEEEANPNSTQHDGADADGDGATVGSTLALYDLAAIVCHHGATLHSGHYTAYVCDSSRCEGGRRDGNERWYHIDDSRVSMVSAEQVAAAEAYVLFYERRQSSAHTQHRERTLKAIGEHRESVNTLRAPHAGGAAGEEQLLLCRGWFARYMATDDPGPVTHTDALCPHDAVGVSGDGQPQSVESLDACFVPVPRPVWADLTTRFAQAAPAAPHLSLLTECAQCRAAADRERQALAEERDEISKLDSTKLERGQIWFIVEASWLKHWREYCWEGIRRDAPGPVCNWRLLQSGGSVRPNLMRARDYRGVNYDVWSVFIRRYGGQPTLCRYELDIYSREAPVPPEFQM